MHWRLWAAPPIVWLLGSFYLGMVATQVALGVVLIWSLFIWRKHKPHIWQSWGSRLVCAYFGCMSVSFWLLHQNLESPEGRLHWTLMAFFLPFFFSIKTLNFNLLHRFLLVVSIPSLIVGTYHLIEPAEFKWALEIGFHMYPRAEGLLSNPIMFSEALVCLACWSIARLQNCKNSKERKWIMVHLVVSILLVVFSRVRAGIVGFLVLGIITAIGKKNLRPLIFSLLILLVVGFWISLHIFGFNYESIMIRLDLFEISWQVFLEHPIFGAGPHAFRNYSEFGVHSHNTLLGLLMESGVVGLSVYLAFMATQLRSLWQLWQKKAALGDQAWAVKALALVFVNYWVFGLFEFNFHLMGVLVFYATHWGIAEKLNQSLHSEAGALDK